MSQQQQKLAIDLEAQVLAAAQSVLGSDRKLKATFNEATGRVEVYQTFVVARMVKNPPREISIADAKLLEGDYAVGSEVTFQLFYGRGDQTRAEQQRRRFNRLLRLPEDWSRFGATVDRIARNVLDPKNRAKK
jgi:hypothetical protein